MRVVEAVADAIPTGSFTIRTFVTRKVDGIVLVRRIEEVPPGHQSCDDAGIPIVLSTVRPPIRVAP